MKELKRHIAICTAPCHCRFAFKHQDSDASIDNDKVIAARDAEAEESEARDIMKYPLPLREGHSSRAR